MNDTGTQRTAERTIVEAITAVAPELASELDGLDPDVDLWEELQLDSMDHLSVMERLSASIGSDIPETDYPQLATMAQLRSYVNAAGTPGATGE